MRHILRYLTSGESHGPALTAILEGMPAGVNIDLNFINNEMKRRQVGYGRGGRMKIESDTVKILSGIRFSKTLGSPISLMIENSDFANWTEKMMQFGIPDTEVNPITVPRPGHADYSGMIKYKTNDLRNILERASARETAAKVAIGAICKQYLSLHNVKIFSHTVSIKNIMANKNSIDYNDVEKIIESNDLRCVDETVLEDMRNLIDEAKGNGDTLGGISEVIAIGMPTGIGSFMHSDRRLDALIAGELMSVPSVKGIEIGAGFLGTEKMGSTFHDQIYKSGRTSNNAGGIEGGMTNGEPIVIRAAIKPIPTLKKPLNTVDIVSGEEVKAHSERSDVCVVPAAGVVLEAALAFVLANAILSDNIDAI